jgi:hypothetical protein
MVPKRIAQALDGDGKPTVRNLAEALGALATLAVIWKLAAFGSK